MTTQARRLPNTQDRINNRLVSRLLFETSGAEHVVPRVSDELAAMAIADKPEFLEESQLRFAMHLLGDRHYGPWDAQISRRWIRRYKSTKFTPSQFAEKLMVYDLTESYEEAQLFAASWGKFDVKRTTQPFIWLSYRVAQDDPSTPFYVSRCWDGVD